MNVLIVLYHHLGCNSGIHVDSLAQGLCARGCDCAVAVPYHSPNSDPVGRHAFRVATFDEVLKGPRLFRDRRGPDVVHCWTSREVVRKFHEQLGKACSFRTVVHMEDNEDHVSRCVLGADHYALACANLYPGRFPEGLTHPVLGKALLARADGFSFLIAAMGQLLPGDVPRALFWPSADRRVFYPRCRNDALRKELGIDPRHCVLVYHGSTHPANFHEVRSLYLAVALLNRTGVPTRLVRTGIDSPDLPDEYHRWASEFVIRLGFIPDHQRLGDILAMADVCVQPGKADAFNDYRFPSKVPEFFACGRPVVLPRTNVGLVTRHLEDAYVLEEATGPAIRDAVEHLWRDASLRGRLAEGARTFAAKHFCWDRATECVLTLYGQLGQKNAASEPPRRHPAAGTSGFGAPYSPAIAQGALAPGNADTGPATNPRRLATPAQPWVVERGDNVV